MIKYLLISLFLVGTLLFLRKSSSQRSRAWKKIFFSGFILIFIVAVFNAELFNRVAHLLGVGRGADLLLYLLIVGFIFTTLNFYIKFAQQEERIVKLARKIALEETEKK